MNNVRREEQFSSVRFMFFVTGNPLYF